MGRLKDFLSHLDLRLNTVTKIEERLCALQAKYESYFAEIDRVREGELAQLQAAITASGRELPAWLGDALAAARAKVERELETKQKALRKEVEAKRQEAEAIRLESARELEKLHGKNTELDAKEERLKAESAELAARIEAFNGKIRELGSGFGFFANLFRMRAVAEEKRALEEKQAALAAQIEGLRETWVKVDAAAAEREEKRRAAWVEQRAQLSALEAKLEALEATRPQLLLRSTLEETLLTRVKEPRPAGPGDPPCPRCKVPNPPEHFFCAICAERLQPDRPDLEGSVEELAQVNLHHRRFSEGMRAGQELIGLVRGLKSGLQAFKKSVESVLDSEKRYPLPKLEIEVPEESVRYTRHFDELLATVERDHALLPTEFAAVVDKLVAEVFTEKKVQRYFETMGEELSRQAKAQW